MHASMKILLIVTGKTEGEWIQQGLDLYFRRLGYYIPFEMKAVQDLKNSRNMSKDIIRLKEGELLINLLDGKKEVYLLDEKGEEFTSAGFARFIESKLSSGCRELVFVTGGPYGFSENVIQKSKGLISLSKLTFSHQMVRLLFIEQLYRAFTIIRGEPYHHE